jgi:hypothetical protein
MGQVKRRSRERKVIAALERTLGIAMGVRILPGRQRATISPIGWVALWLAGYGSLVAAVLYCIPHPSQGHGQVVSLLVWFAMYFALGIYLAVSTTPKILDTIENDIIPHATEDYLDSVASDLERHFTIRQRIGVPLLAATVSVVAALWMFGWDIKAGFGLPGHLYSSEMLLWVVSYFLCFYTAAAGVVGGRFHLFFAKNLNKASSRFFVLGAVETPIVKGLAKLGTQVLIYWVLIFLAIASSMLVAVFPAKGFELPARSWLLSTMVPISLFFSLGIGTLVYLASEASIRSELRRFTAKHAAGLQESINELLFPAEKRLPPNSTELDRLIGWHDRIVGGGRYGSRIGTMVSITLPLLMPVVSLLVSLFAR